MNLRELIKKHENNGGNKEFPKVSWLSLKNDGDAVMVRFLHKGADDLEAYEVHEVEIDGFKTKVKCLGEGCPMCSALGNPRLRMFAQMIDLSDNSHKIWERGISDIKALLSEIEENGDLDIRAYKIKRNGVKGSTKTTYQFYAKDKLEGEAPKRAKVLGFYVKELTAEQMVQAINGTFTFKKDAQTNNTPQNGPIASDFVNENDPFGLEPIEGADMPF